MAVGTVLLFLLLLLLLTGKENFTKANLNHLILKVPWLEQADSALACTSMLSLSYPIWKFVSKQAVLEFEILRLLKTPSFLMYCTFVVISQSFSKNK